MDRQDGTKKSDGEEIRAILDDGFMGRITPEEAADRLAAFGVTGIRIASATVTVDGRTLTPDEADALLCSEFVSGGVPPLLPDDDEFTPRAVRDYLGADDWLGRGQAGPL